MSRKKKPTNIVVMPGTELNQGPPATIMKTYRDHSGMILFHDPRHERCRGTGFLIEYLLVATADGEHWESRAYDCSCRPEMDSRPRFDRDRPVLAGMNQSDLEAACDQAMYTAEQRENQRAIMSELMATSVDKRFGRVMDLVKPAPREMPSGSHGEAI